MYRVDTEKKSLIKLTRSNFSALNLLERYDIQEWVEKSPEILGEAFLIISKELPLRTGLRLDLLAIDKNGCLVVIELKRDDSSRNVDWQSIKYASFCSNLLVDDICRIYSEYLGVSQNEASDKIAEYLNVDINDINQEQRIMLASLDFHPDVISAVLWLRDFGIKIECVRITPFCDEIGQLFIHPDKIIPLPEAEDYIRKKETKARELKRINSDDSGGNLVESIMVETNAGKFRLERYASSTVMAYNFDSDQYVVAKPILRAINEEKCLGIDLLLTTGREKNTRSLGRDVIMELVKQGKGNRIEIKTLERDLND